MDGMIGWHVTSYFMVDVLLTASRNTLSIILGYSMSLKGWREFRTVGISHCCKMANITFTMKIWR